MENIDAKQLASRVARLLSLPVGAVANTIALLDEGATVPFISRYRKERTGSLDEMAVKAIEDEARRSRDFFARREFITDAIRQADAMTPRLKDTLEKADTLTELEDIYAPFKPKRRTRATAAKEKGLEPLARMIMSGNVADCRHTAGRFSGKNGVETVDDALQGASDIIAEWASESVKLRNITRRTIERGARFVTSVVKGKEEELRQSPYAQYADFSRNVSNIPSHQYLALRRAEREGFLKIKYNLDRPEQLLDSLTRGFIHERLAGESRKIVADAVKDAAARLLIPSVENEISAVLKQKADKVAVDLFSGNLRQLLLASPLKGKRVLALDPGYRTGCKTVALDDHGNLLEDTVIYPAAPRNDTEGAARIIQRLMRTHRLDVVALGDGTASRETEAFLKKCPFIDNDKIFVVSENGASVYSASEVARHEFPDKDVTVRGAVSIGRRLIDPLAELVKIDPRSIGVGQYQHDVDQTMLRDALDFTVVSCVNSVGVDLNTASESLLSYVSGVGPTLAANIVKYRTEHGGFSTRAELKKVPRLGDKAFELSAGFLRVQGKEPLDNTGIHPESYGVVREIARQCNVAVESLPENIPVLDTINVEKLAVSIGAGLETVRDIIAELRKPGRDPRSEHNENPFVPGVESFEDIRIGMELPALVANITAFGAFLNLGIKENALLHISQISSRRISSVSDVLRLGQELKVKVIELDEARKRIGVTLLF